MGLGTKIYNRADKVNYMGVIEGGGEKFYRMTGFTEAGKTLNTKTYDRQYVDELSERSDATGYSTKIAYNFDRYKDNKVHDVLADIHDNEVVAGTVNIITVDFNKEGTAKGEFKAKKRRFAVIPDGDGDGTDAYQYSGEFASNGMQEEVVVTSTDNWDTVTVKGR